MFRLDGEQQVLFKNNDNQTIVAQPESVKSKYSQQSDTK